MEVPEQVSARGEMLIDVAEDFIRESQDYFEASHIEGQTILGIARNNTAVIAIQGEHTKELLSLIQVLLMELARDATSN